MATQCKCGSFLRDHCHRCGRAIPGMDNHDMALRLAEAEVKARGETIERYRVALAAMQALLNARPRSLWQWWREESGGQWHGVIDLALLLLVIWGIAYTVPAA